jgi:hypothetical protein
MFCLSNVQSLLFMMIIYELLLLVKLNNKVLNFQLFDALCLYLVWLKEISTHKPQWLIKKNVYR